MNKSEFAILADALKTFYHKEKDFLPNAQAMESWYRALQDIPYQVAEVTVQKWVATNKWLPSVAEFREIAAEIAHGEQMTWGESWEKALGAVRRFGRNRAKEALDSLDPLTRKCVQNIGFTQLCNSENIMVERAHFQKIYETYAQREKAERQIAAPLLQTINLLQLEGGTDNAHR